MVMTRIDAFSAERALHGALDRVTEDLARTHKPREITENTISGRPVGRIGGRTHGV